VLLVGAVEPRGDVVVEGERVPGEAAARAQRLRHPLEDGAPVGPRRQVEERAERAVDQCGGLFQVELAHVAQMELELDACRGGALTRLVEHRRRRVDPDHGPSRRLRDRNRDAAVADRELDERAACFPREPDVEVDVCRHLRGPLVIAVREGLVPAHAPIVRAWPTRGDDHGASRHDGGTWEPSVAHTATGWSWTNVRSPRTSSS